MPIGNDNDLDPAEVHVGANPLGMGAEHDDDRIDRGHRPQRFDRVAEQRPAVKLGELLR